MGKVEVGPKLGGCWPKSAPSGAHAAAIVYRNGEFGRCCVSLKHVQITTVKTFFRAPQVKRYHLENLCVSVAAQLGGIYCGHLSEGTQNGFGVLFCH